MVGKQIAILVLALGVFFGYKISNIYVNENFEQKGMYKMIHSMIGMTITILKIGEYFGYGKEPVNFRYVGKFYKLTDEDEFVKKEDQIIEGVNVRMYSPKVDDTNSSPIMVYYHGGAFVLGEISAYDYYLFEFVKKLKMKIVSVEYRLAPENPYPTPTEDCYKVTRYIMDHSDEFNVNKDKVVLAGDSAGGTIVAALTQRFARENLTQPKLQVLVYPLTQLVYTHLPSYVKYEATGLVGACGFTTPKFAQWYFGIIDRVDIIANVFETNQHFALIDDPKDHMRIKSYFDDIVNIDLKYKPDPSYYTNDDKKTSTSHPRKLAEDSVLKTNQDLIPFFKQLFKPEVSPLLAHESDLMKLPKAYFIIVEWDFLKDEGLLYANRLKNAGVDTHIEFYKNALHGFAHSTKEEEIKVARTMQADLIRYLEVNL